MKNIYLILLCSVHAFFSMGQTGVQHTLVEQEKEIFLKTKSQLRSGSRALNNYDVKYHRLEWTANPTVLAIEGKVTTYFVPSASMTQFQFDLSAALTVDSVWYHGVQVPSTVLGGDVVRVDFPGAIAGGTLDSLSIFYHGIPVGSGLGSFAIATHATGPVLWTLSEPYGAKDWWPCKQDLQDKIDSIDIYVLHPAIYRASSNGILVSETDFGAQRLTHWKHRSPIATYLIAIAISNYAVFTHNVPFFSTNTPIVNYVYPQDSAGAYSATLPCVQQMQLFDTLFGIYPFHTEKYGHTQMGWGGGMEHQTNSFVGGFAYELLAHEMAHQWFGDYITCGSWEDIWLNEGFATYLSGLCYEHLGPIYWMPFKQGQLNSIVSQPDGSVYCDDTTDVNRIFSGRLTYAKGCMILNSLRWVMGDSAFYAGVNNYLHDVDLAFGFSRLQQFKAHMDAACGQDLTWYFNDWYYGQGYPTYHFQWSVDASNNTTVIVNQTQSHSSVSFFEMPLPLYFKNSTEDTTVVVQHTLNGETFTIPLNFKPDSLFFDPELWIISAFNNISGMIEPEMPHVLNVYPSLASDEIFISLNQVYANVRMTITTVEGKLVMQQPLEQYKTKINISGLSKGAYHVNIRSDEINVTRKFVKQ